MRHDRVIGYLDNISSSEPTGYDTYAGTSVSPYIRHAERLRAEGTIGMRNSTVARGRRVPWRPPLATRRMSSGPHASARPDRSRRRPCAPTPARMPAEKRSPDDAAGASTGAFGGAALGALSGGGDALGGRRPAAHLPSTHAKQLRQRAPSRGPWATQMSAPMPTAGRSANRRAE